MDYGPQITDYSYWVFKTNLQRLGAPHLSVNVLVWYRIYPSLNMLLKVSDGSSKLWKDHCHSMDLARYHTWQG